MNDSPAYEAFLRSAASIRNLVRCADVVGLHTLALLRGEEPNIDLIRRLINEDGVSQLAHSWQWYMNSDEYREIERRGHLRAAHEHIVFASYVAVENYLVQKFQEYFRHLFKAPDVTRLEELERSISLRSLGEINRKFNKFIGVSIADFNHPQVSTYEEAPWFHPRTCWEGLLKLETCRNQLAHYGAMSAVELISLVDAWSAYSFCQYYVTLFECNFNSHVYDRRPLQFGGEKT